MKKKNENKADKGNTGVKSNVRSQVQSFYDILDTDTTTTKKIPKGFTGMYLFIEGDTKDLRIVGLN